MQIGVPAETTAGETRFAVTPETTSFAGHKAVMTAPDEYGDRSRVAAAGQGPKKIPEGV